MRVDDIHSLYVWCNEQLLQSHLNAHKYKDYAKGLEYIGEERMIQKVISKIEGMKNNQRPHVKEEIKP